MTDPHSGKQTQSRACYERARQVLVGGVNSPVRAFRAVGGDPVFLKSAKGAHVYDVDGNRYIDLVGTWGPAIFGHAHPEVVKAVQDAAERGLSFGACCESEAELAEIITSAIPSIDMIRFVNSGTEATMSAVRLARAATGRSKLIKFEGCYHGHVDSLLVAAGSGASTFGVPDSAGVTPSAAGDTLLVPYNDTRAVQRVMEEHGSDIAAILVEPVAGNMGFVPPADGFLETLRSVCDDSGGLLIFDEVMTGFRVAWGGYQVLADLKPDITCLGKVIGGGMPVAAYGGRRELMEQVSPLGSMYQAGTLSGNPIGMACGIATLKLCQTEGLYEELNNSAAMLTKGFSQAAKEAGLSLTTGFLGGMIGLAFSDKPVFNFVDAQDCDHERFAAFFRAMLKNGIWLPPSGYEAMFISSEHNNAIIEQIIDAAAASFKAITP